MRRTRIYYPAGEPTTKIGTAPQKAQVTPNAKPSHPKMLTLTADEAPHLPTKNPWAAPSFIAAPIVGTFARRTPVYSQPPFRTVDDLLRSQPTSDEIRAIRTDFNISFDAGVNPTWDMMLAVLNAFRTMRLVRFDAVVPLLNTTNLYEWLYWLNIPAIQFTAGREFSEADSNGLHIRSELLAQPEYRQWVDPSSGVGLLNFDLLLIHEGQHFGAHISHDCAINGRAVDSSLEYGGAWAAQYWAARWFAEHAPTYFTPTEISAASDEAATLLDGVFCDRHR